MCAHNNKPIGMPDIRVIGDVAGRVCALAVETGVYVGDGGDEVMAEGQGGRDHRDVNQAGILLNS